MTPFNRPKLKNFLVKRHHNVVSNKKKIFITVGIALVCAIIFGPVLGIFNIFHSALQVIKPNYDTLTGIPLSSWELLKHLYSDLGLHGTLRMMWDTMQTNPEQFSIKLFLLIIGGIAIKIAKTNIRQNSKKKILANTNKFANIHEY